MDEDQPSKLDIMDQSSPNLDMVIRVSLKNTFSTNFNDIQNIAVYIQ